MLKLLASTLQETFAGFEKEDTLKNAMVRNLWTVLRPNLSEGKFEKVTDQPWAKHIKLGTHRLRSSWVEKRFDNLEEQGFPMALPQTI